MLSIEQAKQRIEDGSSGPYKNLSSAKKTAKKTATFKAKHHGKGKAQGISKLVP